MSAGIQSTFLDYERENNAILIKLQQPAFRDLVKPIIYKKASILVPQNVALAGIDVTKQFILTHVVLTNPSNKKQLLTVNGILGITETKGDVKVMHRISERKQIKPNPRKQVIFSSLADTYAKFSSTKNPLQTVQVLRDGEMSIQGHNIHITLISEPLTYSGCSWSKAKIEAKLQKKQDKSESRWGRLFGAVAGAKETSSTDKTGLVGKDLFWAKFKDPKALDIYSHVRAWVSAFLTTPPNTEEQVDEVRGFIDHIMDKMNEHKLWREATQEEVDVISEQIEKYLMIKIFDCCFSSSIEELARDKAITKRIKCMQFITPSHLDIAKYHTDDKKFDLGVQELRKINNYRAPRDKMICILNCCKVIYRILNKASSQGHPAGADEFLPILIYIVLKANPPQLCSNIQYIQRFRDPKKMITESGYYFTHLESAVDFLENLDATKLNIENEEFARLYKIAEDALVPKNNSSVPLTMLPLQPNKPEEVFSGDSSRPSAKAFSSRDSTVGELVQSSEASQEVTAPIEMVSPPSTPAPGPLIDFNVAMTPSPTKEVDEANHKYNSAPQSTELLMNHKEAHNIKDIDRFLNVEAIDLTMRDIPELLALYKQLAQHVIQNDKGQL